jgi:hypothetical protein
MTARAHLSPDIAFALRGWADAIRTCCVALQAPGVITGARILWRFEDDAMARDVERIALCIAEEHGCSSSVSWSGNVLVLRVVPRNAPLR